MDDKNNILSLEEHKLLADGYILLTEWNKHYSHPALGTLRQYIHKANHNGFDKVYRKAGRVFINKYDYFAWIEGNGDVDEGYRRQAARKKRNS